MIQDQLQTSESHETETKLDLTVEESFFIELMEKLEPSVINIKYMKNEVQLVKIEQFLNYYSEKEIIQLLESLVTKGRIKKNDKGVVLLCPKCGGHAIMTLLLCPRCGSVKIGKRVDLYHAECEYWGQKEEFVEGLLLRCPRCNELLDEDAPEGTPGFYSVSDTNFECQDCGTSVSKNNLKMVCLKCNTKFSSSQTHYLNSVSYALVPEDQITLPKPKKSKPRSTPIEKPVMVKPEKSRKEPEPKKEHEPVSFTEKTEPEIITDQDQTPLTKETEPEIIAEQKQEQNDPKVEPKPEPKIEKKQKKKHKPKKKKQENEILQKSISRVSKLLKPKKKRKKKSKTKQTKKKTSEEPNQDIQEKTNKTLEKTLEIQNPDENNEMDNSEKPVEELEQNQVKIEASRIEDSNLYNRNNDDNINDESNAKSELNKISESLQKSDQINEKVEDPDNSEIEVPFEPVKEKNKNVLMVEDNITVSEFIIESLESLKLPITLHHLDNGSSLLKELRHNYDAIILDLDLQNIDYSFIFSEMQKWKVQTPIILLSDINQNLPKYSLNIVSTIKKKQRSIRKIGKLLDL